MKQPLLLQYYQLLPERRFEENPTDWPRLFRKPLEKFRAAVAARYNEASLQRLLKHPMPEVRQAATLALGALGSLAVNRDLARCLKDDDLTVCQLAEDALWSVWFRGDNPEHAAELEHLVHAQVGNAVNEQVEEGFNQLIAKAPLFAEAYNQRALYYYRIGNYAKAIADCERALRLNPVHFGAASGMGQCYMKQKRWRAALRAFRRALRVHPDLEGVLDMIESLRRLLGGEGKK
jgi:tetratricopeptide (TPR) repeat protein